MGTLGRGLVRVSRASDGRHIVERLGTEHGLTSDIVWSVMQDREGSVWVGTQDGLNQLSSNIATSLPAAGDTWISTFVRGVTNSGDGSVWVGTADGLYRFVGEARTRFGQTHGLPSASILSLSADKSGGLWVGTTAGVSYFRNGRFSGLRLPPGVRLNHVIAMTTDELGRLWLADRVEGLFRWSATSFVRVSLPPEVENRVATAIFGDRRGRVWIGFAEGGLAVHENGKFRRYEPADGIAQGLITSLYEDADGSLWIGAVGGLTRIKNDGVLKVTSANGLPGMVIAVTGDHDDRGSLWLGVNAGIVRVARTEFASLETDSAHQLQFMLLAPVDGVKGNPINASPEVAHGPDGTIWISTTAGVTVIDPRRAEKHRLPPPVKIEAINVNERPITVEANHPLAPRVARLAIEYTALSYVAPSAVRFRYQLEGFDRDWIDAGDRRQAVYTGLPPGRYRFHVIASNDQIWNEVGDEWTFAIVPAFYQTWWFEFASVVGLVLLVGVGWQIRARQLKTRLLLVMEERARIAREIHDTLLQVLIGVALEINASAAKLRSESDMLSGVLLNLREKILGAIRETRQSIWDLRLPVLVDERDLVTALRQACESVMAGAKGVRFEFVVTGIPRSVLRMDDHLLQLGREAVANAVRHAEADTVRVELEYGTDSIVLRVVDDGHGFVLSDVAGRPSFHWGLATMEERAKSIGAEFRVISRPGHGTKVETVARV